MTGRTGGPAAEPAAAALRAGDRRTLARLLSLLEDGQPLPAGVRSALRAGPGAPRPPVLAITGPPGVGKSTLTASLVREVARTDVKVAVFAVDPSSPLTGGALLGDRIRLTGRVSDAVFIRSFANRGAVGGLTSVIPRSLELAAAAGFGLILIETVGVGQSELDVSRYADLTVLVLAPELGDEVQAAKAGLVEIADVVVVNKCDLPGAGRAVRDLKAMIRLRSAGRTDVAVLSVSAETGENLAAAWAEISDRLAAAAARARPAAEIRRARLEELASAIADGVRRSVFSEGIVAGALAGEIPIDEASAALVDLIRHARSRH